MILKMSCVNDNENITVILECRDGTESISTLSYLLSQIKEGTIEIDFSNYLIYHEQVLKPYCFADELSYIPSEFRHRLWGLISYLRNESFEIIKQTETSITMRYKGDKQMIELKPCPFCGGKAEMELSIIVHKISCSKCGAAVSTLQSEGELNSSLIERLTKKWNTRYEDFTKENILEKNLIRNSYEF